MAILDSWTAEACRVLGLRPTDVDPTLVLDLARDVAHGVARPAAPLTAYLVGVAVGRGTPATDAANAVAALIGTWSTDRPTSPGQEGS